MALWRTPDTNWRSHWSRRCTSLIDAGTERGAALVVRAAHVLIPRASHLPSQKVIQQTNRELAASDVLIDESDHQQIITRRKFRSEVAGDLRGHIAVAGRRGSVRRARIFAGRSAAREIGIRLYRRNENTSCIPMLLDLVSFPRSRPLQASLPSPPPPATDPLQLVWPPNRSISAAFAGVSTGFSIRGGVTMACACYRRIAPPRVKRTTVGDGSTQRGCRVACMDLLAIAER